MSDYDNSNANINVQELETFRKQVLDAGLNFDKQSDADLFQEALDGNPNLPLPKILAIAASKKDGVQLLDDYHASHPLTDDSPAPKQAEEKPQRDRDGFSILDQLNRENPL